MQIQLSYDTDLSDCLDIIKLLNTKYNSFDLGIYNYEKDFSVIYNYVDEINNSNPKHVICSKECESGEYITLVKIEI